MATIKDGKGTLALAAFDKQALLNKHEIGRPEPGPKDIAIDIKYCGMCHSDLHASNMEWGLNMYPIVVGHEIAGIVSKVGSEVTDFNVGDRVGVGCLVESCQKCDLCHKSRGLEQHCPMQTQTYGGVFPKEHNSGPSFDKAVGYHTNGGYSTAITVNQHFVFKVPDGMGLEYVGPLLCAGITTFSPLNRHILKNGGGTGKKVGVVGLGGLGHMAVKLAKAMDAEVVVLSRSNSKEKEANDLGASLLVHSDEETLKANTKTCDVILDTVSASHPVAPLMNLLKVSGTYVLLGAIGQPFEISAFPMLFGRQKLEGSLIGGVPETNEMLQFCSKHKILPIIEIIPAKEASKQFEAMAKGTASASRKVIDISTIKQWFEEETPSQ